MFGIKVVSGDKELPELSKDMDHPLYAESIEHGLSLCDDCSGPTHVKLVLAWLPEDKEGLEDFSLILHSLIAKIK